MTDLNVIGQSVIRPDAYDKVTGGKHYPVNYSLPGMLHAKLLRSPVPHAKILSIDTSEAEKLPGVKAVITHVDCPTRKYTPIFQVTSDSLKLVRDMLVMSDTVRFTGQPVAAVAATTPDIAAQALELIDVEYDELPVVFDPEEAMQPGAPQLHAHSENNVAVTPEMEVGDIEAGFAEADHIFEDVYQTQRVHTCYMEPKVCVVDSDRQGNLTVCSSVQQLFGLKEKLAYVLEIPESKVRIIKSAYIGGGFGGKLEISYIEPIAAILSMRTHRPVRIEQTRYEDFISTTRNPIKIYLKTGVKKDGTFTARYAKSILDAGAHATHGAEVIAVHGLGGLATTYSCPNTKWEGYAVYTNNMIGGGYRGYGAPQANFAVESQNDEICTALGLDPIEFRLKNTRRQGDDHPFLPGHKLGSYAIEECLQQGAERFNWPDFPNQSDQEGTTRRGVGMACHPFWVSGCLGIPDSCEHSGALVKLNRDGTADLSTATMDIGSGQITTLCQIVAETLGISVDAVRMTESGDTSNLPFDAPTHASRITYSSGGAILSAAKDARKQLLDVAGTMLEANPEDLTIEKGNILVKGSPASAIPMTDVIARTESPLVEMSKDGPVASNIAEKGTIIGFASQAPGSNPSPVGAEFVEVEVDTETGEVKVERVVYAHDLGRLINPSSAEGQVEGGFQQGMGYGLMEHLQFDPDSGACLTGDFLDYKMPTAVEMPEKIESIFIESNEPTGPYGAKSLSEVCVIVPAAAIANAVYNAVGVRIKELPVTPEKILKGLGKI